MDAAKIGFNIEKPVAVRDVGKNKACCVLKTSVKFCYGQ